MIPFGTGVTLFGHDVPFQVADLNVGILWILAMASLAVYGVVLAGWSSGSNYPLAGQHPVERADDLLRGRDGARPRWRAHVHAGR